MAKNTDAGIILAIKRVGLAFVEYTLPRVSKTWFLKWKFKRFLGYPLNISSPETFNEKINWLKLHYHRPEFTRMVDKYEVKKHVAGIIGEEYIIPNYGVWDRFDDIDFDSLPQSFVLKTTHDSHTVIICRDKQTLDKASVRVKIEASLKRNFYYYALEWPYKNVPPRIIAEALLVDTSEDENEGVLTDYKFFCFDGEPAIMYVSQDAASNPHTDFFDMDYNRVDMHMKDPNSECPPQRPANFEQMKALARKLSAGLPHIRVDFYNIDGHIYFGELTFYHNAGLGPIHPAAWDKRLGDMLKLPEPTCK